jgi:hypothetical protein
MLDTKGDVMFGPLHGPWEKEHTQQARPHISYILINSKNYACGKAYQTREAWATKFSAKNLKDYGNGFHSSEAILEADLSESEDNGPHQDFEVGSQYIFDDDDPPDEADSEEMKDVEMPELDTDNVFLSLIQDFGAKRRKEPWVNVGKILRTHRHPRPSYPPPEPGTQFIIILKGIGTNTYQYLKDNIDDSKSKLERQSRTRTYLKELGSARVDYVDTNEPKCTAAKQNIPLVYGESELGSKNWVKYRAKLEDRTRAEKEADAFMDES